MTCNPHAKTCYKDVKLRKCKCGDDEGIAAKRRSSHARRPTTVRGTAIGGSSTADGVSSIGGASANAVDAGSTSTGSGLAIAIVGDDNNRASESGSASPVSCFTDTSST